jgi:hypothetical protein
VFWGLVCVYFSTLLISLVTHFLCDLQFWRPLFFSCVQFWWEEAAVFGCWQARIKKEPGKSELNCLRLIPTNLHLLDLWTGSSILMWMRCKTSISNSSCCFWSCYYFTLLVCLLRKAVYLWEPLSSHFSLSAPGKGRETLVAHRVVHSFLLCTVHTIGRIVDQFDDSWSGD